MSEFADRYDKPAWQGGPDPLAVAPKGAKKSQMTLDAEAAAASLRSAVEASTQPINEIAAALAKAQGAFKTPKLDCEADIQGREGKRGYKYKYASLHAIREAVTPALAENGIAVVQAPENDNGKWIIRTKLVHSSGQFFECVWPMKFDGSRNQDAGSAMTYARRYSLTCITGIVASDDDDGNIADGNVNNGKAKPIEPTLIDDLNAKIIRDLIKKTETDEQQFTDWLQPGCLLIEHIKAEHVDRAIHALQAKLEKAKGVSEAST